MIKKLEHRTQKVLENLDLLIIRVEHVRFNKSQTILCRKCQKIQIWLISPSSQSGLISSSERSTCGKPSAANMGSGYSPAPPLPFTCAPKLCQCTMSVLYNEGSSYSITFCFILATSVTFAQLHNCACTLLWFRYLTHWLVRLYNSFAIVSHCTLVADSHVVM